MKYMIRFEEIVINKCEIEAESIGEAISKFEESKPDNCEQVDIGVFDGGKVAEILDISQRYVLENTQHLTQ